MSKIKKILLCGFMTLLLTSVLAVPASALNVVDYIPSGYFQLNDRPITFSTGALPAGFYQDGFEVTSYAIYLPFSEVAKGFSGSISVLSDSFTTSDGTLSASYGHLSGGVYTVISDFSSSDFSFSAAPLQYYTAEDVSKSGWIFNLNVSGVSTVSDDCFIRILCSGCDFTLMPSLKRRTAYTSVGTVYWGTALGFYITASGMTSFSSGGSATRQTNGYISTQSSTNSKVKVNSLDIYNSIDTGLSFSATRTSDDAEAVAQLQQINTTLDGMASNLQTITDDFKARENAGNEIGGTATDQDVSAGTSGLSNGNSSISSGIAGLPSFADVMSPAAGYISFLTAPVQLMFNFGNGYLLYIATAMVILSVIFFIIRRMGGGSGD